MPYDRKWRLQYPLGSGYALELDPEAGVSAGNVFAYGALGAMVRFGQDLGVDYGPAHIRPSSSGTTWLRPSGGFGWYVFAGVETRFSARNIFLDGNTFQDSPNVDKESIVSDFSAGLSLYYGDRVKVDSTFTERTEEFTTQSGHDRFGGVNLSWRWP